MNLTWLLRRNRCPRRSRCSYADPARRDPANRGNLLSLTLSFGRRKLWLVVGRSPSPDDAERMPAEAEMILAAHREAGTAEEPRRQDHASVSFWDALDPTEREALRSVASWRTFAAWATIMQEGERADHVIVILCEPLAM